MIAQNQRQDQQQYETKEYVVTNVLEGHYLAGRSEASVDAYNPKSFKPGAHLNVISIDGEWAKVLWEGNVIYVHSDYLTAVGKQVAEVKQNASEKKDLSEEKSEVPEASGDYNQQGESIDGYKQHSKDYAVSHRGNYKHLKLNKYRGVDVNKINEVLNSHCASPFKNKGGAFVAAAKKYNIDPVYFISQAMLESGWGRHCVMGHDDGGTYYNISGVNANDSNPHGGALSYAKSHGWNSVEAAVNGTARFVAKDYIHSDKYGQDTLYKFVHPPKYSWHQYCTSDDYEEQVSSIMRMFDKAYTNDDTFEYAS